MKCAAIIPFYNEEKFIKETIERSLPFVDLVIAINDGSTDSSLEQIKDFPEVITANLNENRGKGYALNEGIKIANNMNVDYIVTLDADLQHPPEFIPFFLEKLKNCDIVIGNRMRNLRGMPIQRIMSNRITSFIVSKKTGIKIPDSQCGYRAYRVQSIIDILPKSSGYEAETEIILKAAKKKLVFDFVPIPAIYGDEKSKIKALKTIISFCRVALTN